MPRTRTFASLWNLPLDHSTTAPGVVSACTSNCKLRKKGEVARGPLVVSGEEVIKEVTSKPSDINRRSTVMWPERVAACVVPSKRRSPPASQLIPTG